MMSIEDHIHQAFSLALEAKQKSESFNFEGQNVGGARGPIDDNGVINLSGSCGLLGYGHPLVMKSLLQVALSGNLYGTAEEVHTLTEEINQHFSAIVGNQVYITQTHSILIDNIGRSPHFLNPEAANALNKGKSLSLKNILGVNISLSSKDERDTNSFSLIELNLLSKVSKFLLLGQFYGEHGLIIKRERFLEKKFSSLKSFKSANGLKIELSANFNSKNLLMRDNFLIFPLSFDEDTVDQVLSALKESGCI